MPLVPMAAAFAPKAAGVMATALAAGSVDDIHHDELALSHDHVATSFLTLPMAKSNIWKAITAPEVAAYNWAHDKAHLMYQKLFGGSDAVGPDQARMVEYFAAGCPHCVKLAPVWKDAVTKWGEQGAADSHKVVWQQKQCLDENWKPGPDFKECMAEHVQRFPTIKFYSPGAKAGDDFFMERTPQGFVDFAKSGVNPSGLNMPRMEGDESEIKMVDFYAAACPHCKHLEPVWDDAHKKWDTTVEEAQKLDTQEEMPIASFEKRQCYDDNWQPGPDSAECKKFGVNAFPSVKMFVPDESGHGFKFWQDYTGPRTADGIVNKMKQESGLDEYLKEKAAEAAAASAKGAAADSAANAAGAADVHAKEAGAAADSEANAAGAADVHAKEAGVAADAAAKEAPAAEADAGQAAEQPKAEMAAVQGNTPADELSDKQMDMDPTRRYTTDDMPPALQQAMREGAERRAAVQAAEAVEQPQAVHTAMMPLPLVFTSSCIPVKRSRKSPVNHQRASASPPAVASHFI